MAQAYPLSWPTGWKRCPDRKSGHFNRKEFQTGTRGDGSRYRIGKTKWLTVADGLERVLAELSRMGIDRQDVIISTNAPTRLDGLPRSGEKEPTDPGAAVYWRKARNAQMTCMAIDQYTTVADNLAAIAATLEAMRAIERHGGAQILERAFLGFAALPERGERPWREILDVSQSVMGITALTLAKESFRALVQEYHPDKGGDRGKFEEVTAAWKQAQSELSN